MQFEVYNSVCADCGHEFDTLNLPAQLQTQVYAATIDHEVVLLDPVRSPIWQDMIQRVNEMIIVKNLPHTQEEYFIEAVINHLFDYSGQGNRFYLWAHIPCPGCDSLRRRDIGPHRPPRFMQIHPAQASFITWQNMPERDKQHKIEEIMLVAEQQRSQHQTRLGRM